MEPGSRGISRSRNRSVICSRLFLCVIYFEPIRSLRVGLANYVSRHTSAALRAADLRKSLVFIEPAPRAFHEPAFVGAEHRHGRLTGRHAILSGRQEHEVRHVERAGL